MLLASSTVIAARSQIIAKPACLSRANEQRELKRMVDEKASAALDSAQAMSARCTQLLSVSSGQLFSNMAAGASIWLDLASGRLQNAQTRAWRHIFDDARSQAAQLTDVVTDIAQAGIAPYHQRVTRNAKRLLKR
jgi:hypothetical protein